VPAKQSPGLVDQVVNRAVAILHVHVVLVTARRSAVSAEAVAAANASLVFRVCRFDRSTLMVEIDSDGESTKSLHRRRVKRKITARPSATKRSVVKVTKASLS